MTHKEIIRKVANDLNLDASVVDKVYNSYWKYIRTTIENMNLKDINQEDFNKIRTNFNVPSLGKFSCTYKRLLGLNKRLKILNKNNYVET